MNIDIIEADIVELKGDIAGLKTERSELNALLSISSSVAEQSALRLQIAAKDNAIAANRNLIVAVMNANQLQQPPGNNPEFILIL